MEKYTQLTQIEANSNKLLLCKNCETKIRKPHSDYPELCCFCRLKRKTIN